jgi:hypothetical protein
MRNGAEMTRQSRNCVKNQRKNKCIGNLHRCIFNAIYIFVHILELANFENSPPESPFYPLFLSRFAPNTCSQTLVRKRLFDFWNCQTIPRAAALYHDRTAQRWTQRTYARTRASETVQRCALNGSYMAIYTHGAINL